MTDRPDITIPEEARQATETIRDVGRALVHEAAMAARPGQMDRLEEMSADLLRAADRTEAAAPLIVAAELQRIADRIQPDGQDPDADHWEDRYEEATDDIASALRVRAAELRGGAQ